MNGYGERVKRHWREWLPDRYAAIADPAQFFADLGLWISDEIARIETELLPPEYDTDEDFMTRVGHRGIARLRAKEIVLHLALPAPGGVEDDDELPATWEPIFEASVMDVEDVVLPRRTPS